MSRPWTVLGLGLVMLGTACASPQPRTGTARQMVLLDFLQRDNAIWRSRDSALLQAKYQKMAADPYNFMRGTAGLFYEDAARLTPDRVSSGFGTNEEARSVWIIGDAHPENLGTLHPEDGLVLLEWVDLDATTYGPWHIDLRRAAQGFDAFIRDIDVYDSPTSATTVSWLGRGYAEGIELAAAGSDPLDGIDGGWFTEDLLEEAAEEGAERKKLGKYTRLDDAGVRTIAKDDTLDDAGKGMARLTREDRARFDDAWKAYAHSELRVLDQARRYGQGVSSVPAYRYVVLVDTGTDGPDDDFLLSMREVVAAPAVPAVMGPPPGMWASDAARLNAAPRLWTRPDADPYAGAVRAGNLTFKVQTWSSWHQTFDHERFAEKWADDKMTVDDLRKLAHLVGRSLAAAHSRGTTLNGSSAVDAIAADIGGNGPALMNELATQVVADGDRVQTDHALFVELLEIHGPLLAADAW